MESNIEYQISSVIKNNSDNTRDNSGQHYGHIVERVVRRDRMGISEIARRLKVSRRTLYNWFESDKLNFEIIRKLGFVIGHDFSVEFPTEYALQNDYSNREALADTQTLKDQPTAAVYYWMDRYIKLLEKFNTTLSQESGIGKSLLIWLIGAVDGLYVFADYIG